jgi:hypothetical protein
MRDAGFDVSFRDCPAKGGTGGHPIWAADSVVKQTLKSAEFVDELNK